MQFVNLTPREIRIRRDCSPVGESPIPMDSDIVIPSTGLARVDTVATESHPIDGIPVIETSYRNVIGLPDPVPEIRYIVALLVMQACPHRFDLLGPATEPKDGCIRDAKGMIFAVRALQRLE